VIQEKLIFWEVIVSVINHSIKIHNSSFERVEEFRLLGINLANQNSIQEEVKSWLKSGNACYYSVQNLLSSRLLSKNLKIRIYRNVILPVVLHGCETCSLTLKEERRLSVFENRVLRRIFGPKRDEVTGNGENYIMRSWMICTPYPISCGWRWAGHVARMGEGKCMYSVLVGKPEG
jgi:hypothetical protein